MGASCRARHGHGTQSRSTSETIARRTGLKFRALADRETGTPRLTWCPAPTMKIGQQPGYPAPGPSRSRRPRPRPARRQVQSTRGDRKAPGRVTVTARDRAPWSRQGVSRRHRRQGRGRPPGDRVQHLPGQPRGDRRQAAGERQEMLNAGPAEPGPQRTAGPRRRGAGGPPVARTPSPPCSIRPQPAVAAAGEFLHAVTQRSEQVERLRQQARLPAALPAQPASPRPGPSAGTARPVCVVAVCRAGAGLVAAGGVVRAGLRPAQRAPTARACRTGAFKRCCLACFVVGHGPAARPRPGTQTAQWPRIFARSRAIDWLCSWHNRDSVTPSTAAVSLRFMSCS